ncbi:MAG TPA: serine/threonine-protein kinase [Micromonosporaceae bacterium]|nr:serine/threonine-protein kinase [Micromonosporaceae bacterium]
MEAGQLFGGRYRLVSRLGTGGMSVVWCARDEVLGREVAVKVLAPKLAADADLLERIRIEARSAARLRHPNIVDIHDYGEASVDVGQPLPYVVMELVEGRSLADLLTAGPLPWRLAVVVGAQVATALAAAHARGVVHRDVTPGNVMLTSTGVKLVDFGISASAGDAEAGPPGHVLGTPAYLAPERLEGGPVRPATDVYALGLLLYKSLTGRLPWQSTTTTQMLKAHLYAEPPPLPVIPGLPGDVVTLCQRCLAKAPQDRPDSIEVARTLAAAVDLPATALALPAELTALAAAGVAGAGRPGPLRRLARAVAGTVALSRQTLVTDGSPTLRPARQPLAVVSAVVGLLLVSGLMGGSLRDVGEPDGATAGGARLVGTGFAAREVQCQVRYEVRRDAAGSFAAGVTVHNADAATVEGWRLEFTFPADQRVVRPWTGGWRQSGRTVTVEGQALAAGGSVATGFDGAYRGTNPLPTQFHLNGSACEPMLVWAALPNPAGGSAEAKPPKSPKPPKDSASPGSGGGGDADDGSGGEGSGDSYRSGGQGNGRG